MIEWIIIVGLAIGMYILIYKYEKKMDRLQKMIHENREKLEEHHDKISKNREHIDKNHEKLQEQHSVIERLWITLPKDGKKKGKQG